MPGSSAAAPHHQLQYLEAMGLTLWTARYRLPNARPSAACQWPQAAAEAPKAPAVRLQALLREAESVEHFRSEQAAEAELAAPAAAASPISAPALMEQPPAAAATPAPLRFSFTATLVEQRWLVICAQRRPDPRQLSLLDALFSAIGLEQRQRGALVEFHWPMIEGLSVEDPLLEARDGLRAFLKGRLAASAAPDWLLLFADPDDAEAARLGEVLAIEDARSELLELPVLIAPSLATLLESAAAKRSLWPGLARLRAALGGE